MGCLLVVGAVALAVLALLAGTVGYVVSQRSTTTRPFPTGTQPPGSGQASVAEWRTHTSPAAWDAVTNRIFFNRHDDQGHWGGYSVLPDGTDERCVTCGLTDPGGNEPGPQRGVSDVTPDGRFAIATVEKGEHPPPFASTFSSPGKGLHNDLWLVRADGTGGWPLTDLRTDPSSGVIWPRFDRTGDQLVWAQMKSGSSLSQPLGEWAMHVARIDWDGDVPVLRDERVYDPQPGRFYEPYQFSPDNSRIIFASDLDTPSGLLSPSQTNSQIWTIDAATFGDRRRVSPDEELTGMFANYNEFALYLPDSDGTEVMFSRTREATDHGMDIWTMRADGTGEARRVTFFNEPDHPYHLGYAVAGGAAFDPRNPKRFVVGISKQLDAERIDAYFVTLP